jgi:multidrug resistance efflux pump
VIGFLLIAATIFFATATYARVEVVTGIVTLAKGVASIVPSRPGVVTAIAVDEGESVSGGQTLARIRAEEDMTGGATVSDRVRRLVEEQDTRLAT